MTGDALDAKAEAMSEAQEFLYGVAQQIRKGVEAAQQLGRGSVRVYARQAPERGGRVVDRRFKLSITADGRATRAHQAAMKKWLKETMRRLTALGEFELTVSALP